MTTRRTGLPSTRLIRWSTHRFALAALATAVAALAACGGSDGSMPGMGHGNSTSTAGHPMTSTGMSGHDRNGMGRMAAGSDGLASTVQGYTLTVNQPPAGDQAMPVTVTISKAGTPVTRFTPEQTKLMHLYLIRSDLTGFQHVHPTMDARGTWSTPPLQATPGSYRLYTQIVPDGMSEPIVLSAPLTVPGAGADRTQALPAATGTGSADGYTVTVTGRPQAGTAGQLNLAITRAGQAVADLQPYLDTYAHVTAIHAGDLAFAHLHPEQPVTGGTAPTVLSLHAQLPRAGAYQLFVQFQTGGTLHTAPVTITAN